MSKKRLHQYQFKKNVVGVDSKPSTFNTLVNLAERVAKISGVFIGSVYFIGYIVTATRLAQHGIPTIRLLDAQYFTAGLLPGILIWLTGAVLITGFRYSKDNIPKTPMSRFLLIVVILFVLGIPIESYLIPLIERNNNVNRIVTTMMDGFYKLILGEISLWLFVVGTKTGYFRQLNRYFSERGDNIFTLLFMLIGFALLGIYQIITLGWNVYNELPQAYGGGKLQQIQLIVDSNKVPNELLIPNQDQQSSIAYTIPLSLVLQTPTEYIVIPIGNDMKQTWVIKSGSIHAETYLNINQ